MQRPKAIFFDLDDTLISAYSKPAEFWTAFLTGHAGLFGHHDVHTVREAILGFSRDFWSDQERHRIWRLKMVEARRHCVENGLALLGITDRALAHRLADDFTEKREAAINLFPKSLETLQTIRRQGIKLALITNGAAEPQRAKVRRFALEQHFDHIQIEGEMGFGKPEDRAYEHLIATFGVAPAEAWIVGDNLEWEVAAPQRHGLYTIWHDVEGQGLPADSPIRPHKVVRCVSEIVEGW